MTPNELTSGADDRNLDIEAGRYGPYRPPGITSNQHTTLARNHEPDRDGDTKGINEGDVTIDSDVRYGHHDCHDTLEEETVSCVKPEDSTDTQDLTSCRPPLPPFPRDSNATLDKTTQQNAQDDSRNQHTFLGKPSTPKTMDTACYFLRPSHEMSRTPLLSPL